MSILRLTTQPLIIFTLISSIILGCSAIPISSDTKSPNPTWENLTTGIKQLKLSTSDKNLILISIDPQSYTLQIIQNDPDSTLRQNIQDIHQKTHSLTTFNGSFFSKEFQPVGLLISTGKTLAPLIKTNLTNGIYWLDKQSQPHLSTYQQFKNSNYSSQAEFAIQNGPILIDEQSNLALATDSSPKRSSRTAIGIDKNNQIIIILLKQTLLNSENSLSLYEFAKLIQTDDNLQELKIHSLLNLDGGTSTGLATDIDYWPELEKVQNIIITKPRSND